MKIICEKQELMKSLNIVLRAVPSKTTMNILYCIFIDATVDEIRFTANDMELGIETRVEGRIEERGLICIEAKLLADIIRKMADAEVVIEADEDGHVVITCEKTVFHISGKDPLEFTPLPNVERTDCVELSQMSLRDMIRQTLFAVAVNDSNRIMTGELMQIREDEMRLVALDGHRIAIRKIRLKDSYPDREVIIPGKAMGEILRILSGESEETCRLYFTKGHVLFEIEGTILVSRLIEGTYFRIDQMLSTEFDTEVTVNKKELTDAVDRAMLFTSESDKRPLVTAIEDDSMDMKIRSNIGSLNESVPIALRGNKLKIGFNPKFILDALRAVDDEEIRMYFLNSKAPCFIRDEEDTYVYLVLPVNFVE